MYFMLVYHNVKWLGVTMGWVLLEEMREHKVDKVFPLPLIQIYNSCRDAATSWEQGLGGTVLE